MAEVLLRGSPPCGIGEPEVEHLGSLENGKESSAIALLMFIWR